jgi:hypothetical protein
VKKLLPPCLLASLLLIAGALVAAQSPSAHYGHHDSVLLPDRSVTPGKVRTTDAQQVCHGGSTKQYRHTTAGEKAMVYHWYAAVKKPGVCCEVDHLISLELGGADEVENLWPQPYEPRPGAHEKDAVENWLHAQVCAGSIPLGQAQAQIATDWYAVYLKMKGQASH